MIQTSLQSQSSPQFLENGKILHVPFSGTCRVASWAIHGGGISDADGVTWLRVCSKDIQPPIDPKELLKDYLDKHGLSGSVGLMTSANLQNVSTVIKSFGGFWAKATATVGLGNSMRIGDHPSPSGRIGTINILCELSQPLSDEGLLEGLGMVTEAKTCAMLEAGINSYLTGAKATGTGTDCIVIASPSSHRNSPYCGKHTTIGHILGSAAYEAVKEGIGKWKRDFPNHKILQENNHG